LLLADIRNGGNYMSINSVLRAMYGLKEALPDAEVKGAHAYSDETTLRQRQLEVLGYLPQLFLECPELDRISIEGVVGEGRDGDGEMHRTCSAEATFSFVFEFDGEKYSIDTTTTDGSEIDDEMEGIADQLCDGDVESEIGRLLERRRVSMVDITSRYENRVKANLENDPTFWGARRQIYLSRDTLEKCHLGQLLDLDALRAHMQLPKRSITSRLAISDVAPPFWNATNLTAVSDRLAAGMDPEACDDNGILPLVAAGAFGQARAAVELLEAGAGINAVDSNGFTAFTAAVAAGYEDMLPLLVERGANPDGTCVVPSLLVAIARDSGAKMIRALLAVGASLEAKTPSGKPFLETFEAYLDRSFKATREEVTELCSSLKTEREVLGTLGGVTSPGGAQRSKARGMSL
jgi:hypothetical protein